jgi:DNA ligase-1
MFPALHYKNVRGKDRVWTIRVQQENNTSSWQIVTETGEVGGKMRTTVRGVRPGKRKNVDLKQKALDQAQSKWNMMQKQIARKQRYKVMLAEKFQKRKTVLYPVLVQPKLDGCRALAYREQDTVYMISRDGLEKANPLEHLKQALKPYLNPDGSEYFDGELYCHGMPRETITGICNSQKAPEATQQIEFHVFDLIDCNRPEEAVEDRWQRLSQRLSQPQSTIKLVATVQVRNRQGVIDYHRQWTRDGYEGVMVRILGSPYENKRSKYLLKYKEFEDEEFEICGYHEGQGDWKGAVIWECWYNKEQGLKFSVKQEGSIEKLQQLYKEADRYIGKLLTVKFQSRMKNGCPEFGVGIELDRRDNV